MIVEILPEGQAGTYYEFGDQRAPVVGEFVHVPGNDAEGLLPGEYEVTRVVFQLQGGDEPARVTCVVKQARRQSQVW